MRGTGGGAAAGARYEVVDETDRDEVVADLLGRVEKRLGR
jgi:hypothetical protein